jgi:type III restriction enzyme
LETYARQAGQPIVKPFLLVIARDTAHASHLLQLMQSDQFFNGRYKDKVIQVDSSRTGAEEDEMVQRLLAVESPAEPTEIVIHVNMLKEGWDVTNLYTIVPLRAANARVLIEQSIGRGLRLPYGKRAGVAAVDRLSIVAHDKFQEIIDEANRPDSPIRLQQVILDPTQDLQRLVTVVSQSNIEAQIAPSIPPLAAGPTLSTPPPIFTTEVERKIAQVTYDVIRQHENLPRSAYLLKDDVQQSVVREVEEAPAPVQLELAGVSERLDIAEIVHKTSQLMVQQSIDIPRILVVPKGEVSSGFQPFSLDTAGIHYQPVDRDLLIQHLRTHEQETLSFSGSQHQEQRLEDYLVRGLIDYDDISYDDHADLLYDLAGQMVKHLLSYLSEEDARNVLIYHQRQLVEFIHVQMQAHYWEKATGYDVVVSKGFTELRPSAFTTRANEPIYDFRQTVEDRSRIAQMLFGGFQRCLYSTQKFQSDSERKLAIILDREALKWFKPARSQFQMYYKLGADHLEYQPDFVAETADCIYMLEAKARNDMQDAEVQAKKDAAVQWCRHATGHAVSSGGKPWIYLLISHDALTENMTLAGLANRCHVD